VQEAVVGTGAIVALLPRQKTAQLRAPAARPAAGATEPKAAAATGIAATGSDEPKREREEEELTLKSVAQTVRVDIRKLDNLMNIVGELGIARAGLTQILDRIKADRAQQRLARELHIELRSLSRKLDELQAGILEVRMVPLGQVFDKLARVVRQISREADKSVNLVITGADTEVDKLIVEELSDPLMHMMRNAIDHGIESKHEREGVVDRAAHHEHERVAPLLQDELVHLGVDAGVDHAHRLVRLPAALPHHARELVHHLPHVALHRVGRDVQPLRDGLVAQSLGDQRRDRNQHEEPPAAKPEQPDDERQAGGRDQHPGEERGR